MTQHYCICLPAGLPFRNLIWLPKPPVTFTKPHISITAFHAHMHWWLEILTLHLKISPLGNIGSIQKRKNMSQKETLYTSMACSPVIRHLAFELCAKECGDKARKVCPTGNCKIFKTVCVQQLSWGSIKAAALIWFMNWSPQCDTSVTHQSLIS